MTTPYGGKGCTCWPNEDYNPWDDRTAEWLPNASCRHHGVLADMLPPRNDTGTYRVVTPPTDYEVAHGIDDVPEDYRLDEAQPEPVKDDCDRDGRAPEPSGGTLPPYRPREDEIAVVLDNPTPCPEGECHKIYNCPRECPVPPDLARAMSQMEVLRRTDGVGPADCAWGTPFSCRVHCPSTTEEGDRGILATVRRWIRGAFRDLADAWDWLIH